MGASYEERSRVSTPVRNWGKVPYEGALFPRFVHQVNTSFTTGGVAHTKTGWTEIVPVTSTDVALLVVDGRTFVSGAETSWLIDFAVGLSGSESLIAQNVYIGQSNGYAPRYIPIFIPIGSRLSARVQSNRTNATAIVQTKLFAGPIDGLSQTVDILGTSTTTSRPFIVSTNNTWTELVSSTSKTYRSLTICCAAVGSSFTSQNVRVIFGVGAAGSEVELGSSGACITDSELCQVTPTGIALDVTSTASLLTENYTLPINAGSRLSLRTPSAGGTVAGFVIGVPE